MQVEPGMLVQPGHDVVVGVGAVVVEDHVDLESLWDLTVNGAQELQELAVAVPGKTLADQSARSARRTGSLSRCACSRGSWFRTGLSSKAATAASGRAPGSGSSRPWTAPPPCRAGSDRRRPLDQLLIETAVIGELEGAHQMRLEPTSRPHTLHRRWAHPGRLGHRPAAPVRLAFRLGLLGQPDDLVDLLRRDLRLTPSAGTNPTQLGQPLLREATPPGHHTRRRDPDLIGDSRAGKNIGCQQQRLSPGHLPMSCRLGLRQALQDLPLSIRHDQSGARSAHEHTLLLIPTYLRDTIPGGSVS